MASELRTLELAGPPASIAVEPWEVLTDVVLQREALHCRLIKGIPANPSAGVYISDDDALAVAESLPGLRRVSPDEQSSLDALLDPAPDEIIAAFLSWLGTSDQPLAQIVRRARLDHESAVLLGLLLAIEIDRSRQQLLGYIQDNMTEPCLQLGTFSRLLPGIGTTAVSPVGALTQSGLVTSAAGQTWAASTLQVSRDLVWAVAGIEPPLPAGATLARFRTAGRKRCDDPIVLIAGGSPKERQAIAAAHLQLDTAIVADEPSDLTGWRTLCRTALIHDLPLIVEINKHSPTPNWSVVSDRPELGWVFSSDAALSLHELPPLPFVELRADDPALTTSAGELAIELDVAAAGHRLGLSDQAAVQSVVAAGSMAVDDAIKRLANGELDELATKVDVRHGWDDLVLPSRQKARVSEVIHRYRFRRLVHDQWGFNRGLAPGIVALFAGPSGTGKTLASQIVASEIGLDLYRVDISSMVSKYIGESEKNLAQVFDAAENGAVALLFDEADALFGKRSEVKDSHDRYANLSTSYLLQRIESFNGVVLLSTNLSHNIDSAFRRRIDVQVTFAMPEAPLRREIWERAIPPDHHASVDLDHLATTYELTGASIHNAVLSGAHLAAAEDEKPTTEHYEVGVRRELQKLGKFGGFAAASNPPATGAKEHPGA